MRIGIIAAIVSAAFALNGCSDVSQETRLASAEQNVSEKNYKEAVIEYKNLLQEDPSNAETRSLLAKALYQDGDLEGAEKEFSRSIDAGVTSRDVLATYALTLYFQSKFSEAVLVGERFKTKKIPELNLVSYMALLRNETANPQTVKRRKIQLQGEYLSFAETLASFLDGNYSDAKEKLYSVSLPYYFEPLKLQLESLLLSRSGDLDGAVNLITPLANRWERVAVIALTQLEILIAAQDYDEAKNVLEHWVSKRGSPMFDLLLADVSLRQSDFENSFTYGENAIRKGVNTYQSNLITGISALNLSKVEVAYTNLQRAYELNPKGQLGARYLAKSQLALGYTDEATQLIKKLEVNSQLDLEFMLQASEYLKAKQNTNEAIDLIKSALDQTPNSLPLLVQLATLQFNINSGNYQETLSKLESLSKDSIAVAYLAVQGLIAEEKFDEALERAKAFEEDAPTESLVLQGTILFNLTNFEGALSKAEEAHTLSEKSLPAVRLAMLASYELGKLSKAIDYAEIQVALDKKMTNVAELIFLVELHPDFDVSLYLDKLLRNARKTDVKSLYRAGLVKYHLKERDVPSAFKLLNGNVENNPLLTLSEKLQILTVREESDKVDSLLNSLFSKDLATANDFILGVAYYFSKSELPKAKKLLEQAESIFPEDKRFVLGHFEYLLRTNKFEQAEAKLNQIRGLGVEDWQVKLLAGQKAMLAGDVVEAEAFMTQSYNLYPLKSTAIVLAKVLSVGGKQLAGFKVLSNSLLEEGRSIERDFHTTAEYAVAHGFFKEGKDIYGRLLEKWPNSAVAKNNLASLLIQLKEFEDAERYSAEAVKEKRSPAYLDTYGWALFNLGEIKESQALFEEALAKDGSYEEAAIHLAMIYVSTQQRQKAEVLRKKYMARGSSYENTWNRLL